MTYFIEINSTIIDHWHEKKAINNLKLINYLCKQNYVNIIDFYCRKGHFLTATSSFFCLVLSKKQY